jgi:predicted kinase
LRYQDLAAASLAEMMPPVLCFVSGPMGSGKSFLASHLAEATQTLLLESDRVRRELYGPSDSLLAYGQGRYRELDRKQVYQRMCEQAREQLARGRSVLVDASFDSPSFWQIFRSDPIFERYPVAMLVCRCREAVAVDRIERRRETMGVLSDARTDLYQKQMERCTWEFDTRYAKPVDTEQSIEALLEESLSFIGEQVWHFLHRRR